jgi:osmotically-inducible protein OsmY
MSVTARTDRQIQAAVEAELEWTPDVDAAGIGVAVDDSVVSLSGEVDDYAARSAAKRAALRLHDVTAVVNDLDIHPKTVLSVSNVDIGKEVIHALKSATNVPDTVKAEIDAHSVTLTGQVDWDFERRAAKRALRYLRGVHSVENRITLTPRASAVDTGEGIRRAILRQRPARREGHQGQCGRRHRHPLGYGALLGGATASRSCSVVIAPRE